MSPTARPDRETLLLWVSAFFDGELQEGEEAQLFEAMAEDPSLEAEFLHMERTLGATAELAGMADAVMAQVAPEAVSEAGAPALLSAYLDDEADAAQRHRFTSLVGESESAAREALSFLHAAEGVGLTLFGLPESPAARAAVAAVPAAVLGHIAREERSQELVSAFADDALDAAELEELHGLVGAGASLDLSFVHVGEAVAYAVRAPISDPAAARAGAAALHAIEAEALRSRTTTTTSSASGGPSFVERVRSGLGSLFAPLAAAACAALLFIGLQGAPSTSGGVVDNDSPPEDWARAFMLSQGDDLLASATSEDIEVLGDNSDTEVQAIDSGSHMAAVFSTEASSITVIWVPEPAADVLGADITESGT